MSNEYVSAYAKCPFYKSEKKQEICCEGIIPLTCLHFTFASTTIQKEYKKSYCYTNNYKACQLYVLIESKYD